MCLQLQSLLLPELQRYERDMNIHAHMIITFGNLNSTEPDPTCQGSFSRLILHESVHNYLLLHVPNTIHLRKLWFRYNLTYFESLTCFKLSSAGQSLVASRPSDKQSTGLPKGEIIWNGEKVLPWDSNFIGIRALTCTKDSVSSLIRTSLGNWGVLRDSTCEFGSKDKWKRWLI